MEVIRKIMNREYFKEKDEKKKMSTTNKVLSVIFCLLFVLYLVYLFIFQMECIIYKGQNVDGTINWGSVIPTVLLFMFCGPCMFVYRLINRCTNGKEVSNVRRSRNNAISNVNTSGNNNATGSNTLKVNNTPKVKNNARSNTAPAVSPQTNTSQKQVTNS